MSLKNLFVCLLCVSPFSAVADEILLKNGSSITANRVWEDNGKVYASNEGSTISFNASLVEAITSAEHLSQSGQSDPTDPIGSKVDPDAGFVFDVWYSGQTLKDIFATAESNDIPLRPEGIFSLAEGFDTKLTRENANKATSWYYKTELLGKPARVRLQITPASKRLYALYVEWDLMLADDKEEFTRVVEEMVTAKYQQQPSRIPLFHDVLYTEKLEWKLQESSRIVISKARAGVLLDLSYVDLPWLQNAKMEKKIATKEAAIMDGDKL